MRRIIGLFVLLALAGGVGTLIARDPGYVLLTWSDLSVETSIWFFGVLLLILLFGLRALLVGFGLLFGSRTRVREWNQRRLQRRAQKRTTAGLLALAEGDFAKARKALEEAAARVDAPLVNHLAAARAAHELQAYDDRDALLQRALEATPKATLAVGIAQAEMQMGRAQHEQALATLLALRAEAPRNAYVLRMLRRTYAALGDWQGLLGITADLRKSGALAEEEVGRIERDAHCAELERCGSGEIVEADRPAAVRAAWDAVPKGMKTEPLLLATYVRQLMAAGDGAEAESVIRRALRKSWDPDLVALYGQIEDADAAQQLVAAQGWVPERPNDEVLLLTLGRLCLRNERFSRGREYLEASLAQRATAEACGELGRLCAHLGESERAAELLEQAMQLGIAPLQTLPLPETDAGTGVSTEVARREAS